MINKLIYLGTSEYTYKYFIRLPNINNKNNSNIKKIKKKHK